MEKKNREPIPTETAALVLFLSDRTCCVCRVRGKPVQIHHIDEDPSNNSRINLAVLCFDCHRETQIQGGFDRKLDAAQVTLYRDDWLRLVSQTRSDLHSDAGTASEEQPPPITLLDKSGEYLLHAEDPVVVWRLPRGALVLSSLVLTADESVADYCSYNGSWLGSTHYHPAYSTYWWEQDGLRSQYRKLQIERGDWDYARKPLRLMSDIVERRLMVRSDGTIKGNEAEQFHDPDVMKVYVNEDIPFPHVPEKYFRLAISGPLRDLSERADDIGKDFSRKDINPDYVTDIRRNKINPKVSPH